MYNVLKQKWLTVKNAKKSNIVIVPILKPKGKLIAFYCNFPVLQIPGYPVPAGAESSDGLDLDRLHSSYWELATDGGHLRQHLCPQVLERG